MYSEMKCRLSQDYKYISIWNRNKRNILKGKGELAEGFVTKQ